MGYRKGARSERELKELFSRKGYSVIRAAGSGVGADCPDILVFKGPRQYAFECKSWNAGSIAIDKKSYRDLERWEENSGITTLLAWRVERGGWLFIYLSELEENPKSYSITMKRAGRIGRNLSELLG